MSENLRLGRGGAVLTVTVTFDRSRIRETPKLNRVSASSLLTLIEMVDADLASGGRGT